MLLSLNLQFYNEYHAFLHDDIWNNDVVWICGDQKKIISITTPNPKKILIYNYYENVFMRLYTSGRGSIVLVL